MMTFFREWLPLAKSDFRILALLADKGDFEGNLSDLCRYFSLDPQTKNRNKLRESIFRLSAAGLILHKEKGRTHQLALVPQTQSIEFPRTWYEILRQHDYTSESVSWEAVMKVALWIQDNQLPVVKIGSHSFENSMFAKAYYKEQAPDQIEIGASIVYFGAYAFADCRWYDGNEFNLLISGYPIVEYIGEYAFANAVIGSDYQAIEICNHNVFNPARLRWSAEALLRQVIPRFFTRSVLYGLAFLLVPG